MANTRRTRFKDDHEDDWESGEWGERLPRRTRKPVASIVGRRPKGGKKPRVRKPKG
jgi:hypothetical protein